MNEIDVGEDYLDKRETLKFVPINFNSISSILTVERTENEDVVTLLQLISSLLELYIPRLFVMFLSKRFCHHCSTTTVIRCGR